MIVYTLETSGLLQNENGNPNLWGYSSIMLRAMQLSVALAAKKEVPVIYADEVGQELCKLLHMQCDIEPTEFPDYPKDMFGLSKLHVYSKQTKPFTSLDFDVFVQDWSHFDASRFQVFCPEPVYSGSPYSILSELDSYSMEISPEMVGGIMCVFNLGFYNCPDLEINKRHVDVAFGFYEKNKAAIDILPKNIRTKLNMVLDQYSLTSILRDHSVEECQDSLVVNLDADVVHMVGAAKSFMHNAFWICNQHKEANLPSIESAWDFWEEQRKKNLEN